MRIAFVSISDPLDKCAWSGSTFHMYQALDKAGHEMIPVGPLGNPYKWIFKVVGRLVIAITGKRFSGLAEPLLLESYARQIYSQLDGVDYDVLLACHAPVLAELSVDKPMAFFADATFAAMDGYYESHSNLCFRDVMMYHRMETEALSRCDAAFYASDWAAESAVKDYGVSSGKVYTVPFGANMECARTEADVQKLVCSRSREHCHLLFIGYSWERKGGDFAVAVARHMNQNGVTTTLHIVGCEPLCPVESFMKVYGCIDKKTEKGRVLFDSLFHQSHFLIVPSRVECYGVVFCEASSFGTPSIATRTGGIPTVVKDGENGFLVELDSDPAECAGKIQELFENADRYARLSMHSFARYKSTLCWEAAARTIGVGLKKIVERNVTK